MDKDASVSLSPIINFQQMLSLVGVSFQFVYFASDVGMGMIIRGSFPRRIKTMMI